MYSYFVATFTVSLSHFGIHSLFNLLMFDMFQLILIDLLSHRQLLLANQ